jgi:hypothetical protein
LFAGMTMKQSRRPLNAKNEKNEPLSGLYEVEIEADWTSGSEPQSKKLSFYVLRSR